MTLNIDYPIVNHKKMLKVAYKSWWVVQAINNLKRNDDTGLCWMIV